MTGPAKLTGLAALANRLNLDPALRQALAEAGDEVVHRARDELAAQGADAALAGSLKVSVSASQVEVGSEHPAARTAEFGTLHRAPKPWLQPAFQAALGPARARLRQALKDHVTRR
ncbi:MAG: hypothetical protein GY948_15965 [Alphaproteobacteria bacterium]|nr:hypothetical protein [Alphaproteobacteria bacterium]